MTELTDEVAALRARVAQLEGALAACIRDWGREVYDRSITPEHLPEALKLARVALARTSR